MLVQVYTVQLLLQVPGVARYLGTPFVGQLQWQITGVV